MTDKKQSFDKIFGIGFRIGFLIVLVDVILVYFTYFTKTVELALNHYEFFNAVESLPWQLQVLVYGLSLMGVAIVMVYIRDHVENLVNLLFYNDRH